jgi:tryptophan halogenase
LPHQPLPVLAHRPDSVSASEPLFSDLKKRQQDLAAQLPTTYEYLKYFHGK